MNNDFYIEYIDIDYDNLTFNNFRVYNSSLKNAKMIQYTKNRILKINTLWTIQFENLLSMVYKGV